MYTWRATEGSPTPLGVTWIAEQQAYNFALYARHATEITLLLYADTNLIEPVSTYRLHHLRHKTGRIWHCRIPRAEMRGAVYYAYQVDGPPERSKGHRFDRRKVLLDPYAPAVYFPPSYSRAASCWPGPNAARSPLGLIESPLRPFNWGNDRRPRHAHDTVIYELHIKGFTRSPSSGISEERRGTYAGVIDKIPYLKALGVTVVELLPIYQYDPQEGNYWGYMPLHFFSPHQGYAISRNLADQFDEFRAMVKALHAADIEVILDVVYNHTSEGDDRGPCYSFRGIDNSTYYLMTPNMRYHRNDAGTGNVLRCGHPAVRRLIVDSMRFWVNEMHVDGFRFDLASIFTRDKSGAINLDDPALFADISDNPDFANIRLIAEAWDVSSYQLGRSFPGSTWLQWNGMFRDDVRSFVRGEPGKVGALMSRLYGSDDLFPDELDSAYHAYQSVNFITAHDGFCLYDLVSYDHKHNEANGHHNTDGSDDNRSWNCGWEGDQNAPREVLNLRKRQIKNFCCLLMVSNGTPMFCAGDEFANTQGGNNNPYNQDNQTTWLNWERLQQNQDLFRFFQHMIAFRKAHPSLGRSRYWREDVRWYGSQTIPDLGYHSRTLAFCLHGASLGDSDIYVMINAYWDELPFTVQEGQPHEWRRIVDTNLAAPDDFADPGEEFALREAAYTVAPRSIVILERKNT
jgi:glycogen operon protein